MSWHAGSFRRYTGRTETSLTDRLFRSEKPTNRDTSTMPLQNTQAGIEQHEVHTFLQHFAALLMY